MAAYKNMCWVSLALAVAVGFMVLGTTPTATASSSPLAPSRRRLQQQCTCTGETCCATFNNFFSNCIERTCSSSGQITITVKTSCPWSNLLFVSSAGCTARFQNSNGKNSYTLPCTGPYTVLIKQGGITCNVLSTLYNYDTGGKACNKGDALPSSDQRFYERNDWCRLGDVGAYTASNLCGSDTRPSTECVGSTCLSATWANCACTTQAQNNGNNCGGAPSGDCDLQDTCSNGVCVDNVRDNTYVCRDLAGGSNDASCDVQEKCPGPDALPGVNKKACPTDAAKNDGVDCGTAPSASDLCDLQDTCKNGKCVDNVRDNTYVCRDLAGGSFEAQCDVQEKCPGPDALPGVNKKACPTDAAKNDGDTCVKTTLDSGPNSCDAADQCESGQCVEKYQEGTLCRESAGCCDAPDYCPGGTKECPDNKFTGELCGFAFCSNDQDATCVNTYSVCDGGNHCPNIDCTAPWVAGRSAARVARTPPFKAPGQK